eukprot:GHVO01005241.1.p1 GENE.GHVO01005241.1~~GHVO01005241.1.p1  ORF type:complete len:444 (-),score=56.11 GHVO01005241.1:126-1457(-)
MARKNNRARKAKNAFKRQQRLEAARVSSPPEEPQTPFFGTSACSSPEETEVPDSTYAGASFPQEDPLAAPQDGVVEMHLATCSQCMERWAEIQRCMSRTAEEPPRSPPSAHELPLPAVPPPKESTYRSGEDGLVADELMGVADGVSQHGEPNSPLRELGFDPRFFAEELLKGASARIKQIRCMTEPETKEDETPYRVSADMNPSLISFECLASGYDFNKDAWGSATCVIASLDKSGQKVGIANLGDSGALILRRTEGSGSLTVLEETTPQQRSFNAPFQLTRVPPPEHVEKIKDNLNNLEAYESLKASRPYRAGGRHDRSDKPQDADLYETNISEGDLIILGTDGLFDNLFVKDIAGLCGLAVSPYESKVLRGHDKHATCPRDITKALALAAYWRTLDDEAETPFSKACNKESQNAVPVIMGGKSDDISVICGWVVAEDNGGG